MNNAKVEHLQVEDVKQDTTLWRVQASKSLQSVRFSVEKLHEQHLGTQNAQPT